MMILMSHTNPENLLVYEYNDKIYFVIVGEKQVIADKNNFYYLVTMRLKNRLEQLSFEESDMSIYMPILLGKVILNIGGEEIEMWRTTYKNIEDEILLKENILQYNYK